MTESAIILYNEMDSFQDDNTEFELEKQRINKKEREKRKE